MNSLKNALMIRMNLLLAIISLKDIRSISIFKKKEKYLRSALTKQQIKPFGKRKGRFV